ncbi:MAG: dihydroorotate dehydrogenase electron transfer subunit [Propionibacteriaceae bacterium]|nr:dihydroorotate dehydrogenase electron transfer subunit [Propionibacteriaceae bacterium]
MIESAAIVANRPVGPSIWRATLAAPGVAAQVRPGQFVHVRLPGHVLRRPLSVYAVTPDRAALELVYQVVGAGTQCLSTLRAGAISVLGPLGRGFEPSNTTRALPGGGFGPLDGTRALPVGGGFEPSDASRALPVGGGLEPSDATRAVPVSGGFELPAGTRALLVGGGLGAAPLHLLGREFAAAGVLADLVLGARTAAALVGRADFETVLGSEHVFVTTDDGSAGVRGQTTAEAARLLAANAYGYVATCGPEPMQRAVAALAATHGVPCDVSLERRMACGVGACLTCVVTTRRGKARACVDGPVFRAEEVVW